MMICAVLAAEFSSSALAADLALETRFVVRPKSVINWLTAAPVAARG
jgi:hypothetical protein